MNLLGFCQSLGHAIQRSFGFFFVKVNVVKHHGLHGLVRSQEDSLVIKNGAAHRIEDFRPIAFSGDFLRKPLLGLQLEEEYLY